VLTQIHSRAAATRIEGRPTLKYSYDIQVPFQKYDLFMSYSREDSARVRPLVEALRGLGYRVFFDLESIKVGDQWKRRLESSIRESRALVLCWSARAKTSEFVQFEYNTAGALRKKVLPWLLDETPLPPMLEIQGIKTNEPALVATELEEKLGWSLTRRRYIAATATGATLTAAPCVWIVWPKPPPPPPPPKPVFRGHVEDERGDPVAGAIVSSNGASAITQADGSFVLTLASSPGETITFDVTCRGYQRKHVDNAYFRVPDFGIILDRIP
jgi:TIR domain